MRKVLAAILMAAPLGMAAAQNEASLTLNTPVDGTIEQPGTTVAWSLYALRDDVLTFKVEAEAELDPVVTLQTVAGVEVIRNDDVNYPQSKDAILEAITIPQTGDYKVVVSGYGQSTGDFTLTMLPGYAHVVLDERFPSLDGWETDEAVSAEVSEGLLTLEVDGIQQSGGITEVTMDPLSDYYAQFSVVDIQERNGWTVGFSLRRQANGDHYLVVVNSEGVWRFTAVENGMERVIRDWAPHPAIVAGDTRFTLSVLVNGNGFDVFYNRQLLARLADGAIRQPGNIGLALTTANALGSMVRVVFDDVMITAPLEIDGDVIFPEQLVRGNTSLTVQELERRHIMPAGGQLALTVEESFFESRSPGVSPLTLARGTTFRNFAMSVMVSIQNPAATGISGCGLFVRGQSETDYMIAYIDSAGGFGVSQRAGNTFQPGIYAENPAWSIVQPNELLLVLVEDSLYYFVNGFFAGSMEIEPVDGEVGNVVVNFDPVPALCRFEDTWVWRLG